MYVIWDCICGWFMFNPIKTFSTTAPTRNIWQEQVSLSATVTRTTGIRKGLPVMEHMSTMLFGSTAQTRRLRQPRPAAAAAADQNIQFSSKSDRWGRWKSKESWGVVAAAAADMWCLVRADVWDACQKAFTDCWQAVTKQYCHNTVYHWCKNWRTLVKSLFCVFWKVKDNRIELGNFLPPPLGSLVIPCVNMELLPRINTGWDV